MSSKKNQYPICEGCGLRHRPKEDEGDCSGPKKARLCEEDDVLPVVEVSEDADFPPLQEGGQANVSSDAKMVMALGLAIPYLRPIDQLSLRESSKHFFSQQTYALRLDYDQMEILPERRIGYVWEKLEGGWKKPYLMKKTIIQMMPIQLTNYSEEKYPNLLKSVSRIIVIDDALEEKTTKDWAALMERVGTCGAHVKEIFITFSYFLLVGEKERIAEILKNPAAKSLKVFDLDVPTYDLDADDEDKYDDEDAEFDLSLLKGFPSLESVVIRGNVKVISEESIIPLLKLSSGVRTLSIQAPVSLRFFNDACQYGIQLRELSLTIDVRKNLSFFQNALNKLKTWAKGTVAPEIPSFDNLQCLKTLKINFLLTKESDRPSLEEWVKAIKDVLQTRHKVRRVRITINEIQA